MPIVQIRAVQKPRGTTVWELDPAEWCWGTLHTSQGPKDTLIYRLPNGKSGVLDENYTITGDGETITVAQPIHHRGSIGQAGSRWHGNLTDGFWYEECK